MRGLLGLPSRFDYSPKYVPGKDYFGWTPKPIVKTSGVGTVNISRALVFSNPKYPDSKIWFSETPWQPVISDARRLTPSDAIKPMNLFPPNLRTMVNMTGAQSEFTSSGEIEPNPTKPIIFKALPNPSSSSGMSSKNVSAHHLRVDPARNSKIVSVIETNSDYPFESTETFSHELGHHVELNRMTDKEHDSWLKLSKKRIEGIPQGGAVSMAKTSSRPFSPTKYGSTNELEDFSETFAAYQSGKLDSFYGDKIKAINERIRQIGKIESGRTRETPRDVISYSSPSDLPNLLKLKHGLESELSGRKQLLKEISEREGIGKVERQSDLRFVDNTGEFSGFKGGDVGEPDLPIGKKWREDADLESESEQSKPIRPYYNFPSALIPDIKEKPEKKAEPTASAYSSEPSEEEIDAATAETKA